MLPLLFWYRKRLAPAVDAGRYWFFLVLAGFMFALDLTVWHRSIIYTGAGIATILGNTQAIHLALFGILFGKEKWSRRLISSLLFAFVGIYFLIEPNPANGPLYWFGVGCGLATGVFYAAYILCLKQAEMRHHGLPAFAKLGLASLITATFMIVFALIGGERGVPSGMEWTWILLLSLIPQILGWGMITIGLRKTSSSTAGLIILFQPIGSAILSYFYLGEVLSPRQLLGAGLTLFSIYLGATRKEERGDPSHIGVVRT